MSPRVALGADVAYTHFFWEGNALQNVSGESLRHLLVGAHVKIKLLAPTSPWIAAGAGVAMIRHRVEYYRLNAVGHPETFLNETNNLPAIDLGAGLGLWNNGAGVKLGLSANYAWIVGDLLIDEAAGLLGSENVGQQLTVGFTLSFEHAPGH